MDWLDAAMIGLSGGATMEAVDVIKSVRWHRQMPWKVRPETIDPPRRRHTVRPGEESLPAPGWLAYCVAGTLRVAISGAVSGVLAATYSLGANPLVAFLVGLGALGIVQQAVTFVPLIVTSIGRAALAEVASNLQNVNSKPAVVVADNVNGREAHSRAVDAKKELPSSGGSEGTTVRTQGATGQGGAK